MNEWAFAILFLAQILITVAGFIRDRKQRQINANAEERFRILENWVVKLVEERYSQEPVKGEKGCQ